jgi:surface antigen
MSVSKSTGSRISKSKRLRFKASSFAIYTGTWFVLVVLAMSGYKSPNVEAEKSSTTEVASVNQSVASASAVSSVTTLDDVRSANLAANVASSANLSVADSVYNQSISVSAGTDIEQYNATVATKVQITDPTVSTSALISYTAVEGDTATSVADKFGISAQTIRWANNLTSDAVTVGSTMVVPALDGVIYTVKAGDDLNNIATKYKSDVNTIITVNNLEGAFAQADTKLILPGGILPEDEQPGRPVSRRQNNGSGSGKIVYMSAAYAGNKYSRGYCTWYVYNRRAELGRPIPSNLGNANTWASRARGMINPLTGTYFVVNRTPAVGAVMQNGGGLGHVAVVERINPDGSIVVSEMNAHYGVDFDGHRSGWGRISHRIVHNPGDYNFIH